MRLGISEILKNTSAIKSRKEKIEYLRKNDSTVLRQIFNLAFNPAVKFLLPDTPPPYTPAEYTDLEGQLYSQLRRMYLFIEGGGREDIPQAKREYLFIQFIESIDKEDANLICNVIQKKIGIKGITKKLAQEAFPDLPLEEPKNEQAQAKSA